MTVAAAAHGLGGGFRVCQVALLTAATTPSTRQLRCAAACVPLPQRLPSGNSQVIAVGAARQAEISCGMCCSPCAFGRSVISSTGGSLTLQINSALQHSAVCHLYTVMQPFTWRSAREESRAASSAMARFSASRAFCSAASSCPLNSCLRSQMGRQLQKRLCVNVCNSMAYLSVFEPVLQCHCQRLLSRNQANQAAEAGPIHSAMVRVSGMPRLL